MLHKIEYETVSGVFQSLCKLKTARCGIEPHLSPS